MTSGQGEAVRNRYHLHVGKSGRAWLVADREDCADHVYCTAYADWDRTGEGFAGAHLKLPLVDDNEFILKGGWHSNSQALLADTGVDITDRHLTYGAIGFKRLYWSPEHPNENMGVGDVIFADEEPTLGDFHRIEELAKQYANELGETIYYSVQSSGGGSSGPIYPN